MKNLRRLPPTYFPFPWNFAPANTIISAARTARTPMKSPFDYVKSLQAEFDYGKIEFGDEYYDVLGIEK